jgi:hypothetical protein
MSDKPTQLELANCTAETLKHIKKVSENILNIVVDLLRRQAVHDQSKLEEPELSGFARLTSKLGGVEYNSDEYKRMLEELKPTIDHHYSRCGHHPEHWPNGINDMTLVDLIEMYCDWKAAAERNKNGNIHKSIEVNAKRYNIDTQLRKIFENTAKEF